MPRKPLWQINFRNLPLTHPAMRVLVACAMSFWFLCCAKLTGQESGWEPRQGHDAPPRVAKAFPVDKSLSFSKASPAIFPFAQKSKTPPKFGLPTFKLSLQKPKLIQGISEELQKRIAGTYIPFDRKLPPSAQGIQQQPIESRPTINFEDLPQLDDTPRLNKAIEPLNLPSPTQDDLAPQQDLRDDNSPLIDPRIEFSPEQQVPLPEPMQNNAKIEMQETLPYAAPPVEVFGQPDKDLYQSGKPDSQVAFPLWWDELVVNPQIGDSQYWNVGINELIAFFLKNSPRLRAIQWVRESAQPAIPENIAEFDPTVFVESNFARLNDPVGNTLTTGGANRFQDNNWTTRGGLRKKFRAGGTLEAFQRFGIQTNNSDFFVPEQQGTAFLSLNFSQPLLNGRGKLYNESLIAIATLENNLAGSVAEEKIQTELLKLAENYWQLYSFRAIWLQKLKNVKRAESIYNELQIRKGFDVSTTQLFRAKAAVETRKAELVEALNNVRDIESQISAIIGIDIRNQRFEYVPNFPPNLVFPKLEMGDAFVTALSNRPEILQAGQRAEIAATKTNRSKHEVLPILDLILGTYVSGLDQNYEFIDAFGRQFSDGAPGYSAALNFEMPIHRRAARARLEREQVRWKAVTSEFEDKVLQVQSEVDIAVREVETAFKKLQARAVAMESAKSEMNAQRERLGLALSDGDNIGNTLNFLLDAQDRLADQENLLAQAQADYMVSWVALKKAMGTLVLIESGN